MSMCSDRYAEETPLGFSKYQLPPTSSDASKQAWGTPKSDSALQAVSPLTPAPITHTEGSSPIRSGLHLDTLPEGEVVLDLSRGVLRGGVVPGGIRNGLSGDVDRLVAGFSLPRTDRVRVASQEVLLVDAVGREVVVALDHHRLLTVGQRGSVPCSFQDPLPRCEWSLHGIGASSGATAVPLRRMSAWTPMVQ